MLTRREILRSGALLALLPGSARAARTSEHAKVLVIGAGASGLAAAVDLKRAGFRVTVLEADQRAGGRMRTVREPFADEQVAEAGALVLSSDNPGLDYARELGLELRSVPLRSDLGQVVHVAGERRVVGPEDTPQWPLPLRDEEQGLGIRALQRRYHYGHLPGESASLEAPLSESLRELDALSLSAFWRRNGASDAAAKLMQLRYFHGYADDLDTVSALQPANEWASMRGSRGAFQVVGGNDRIARGLADELRRDVHFGAEVTAVRQDETGVRVTVRTREGQDELEGDLAICTVPLQVLGNIHFEPELSPLRRRAVAEIGSADATRVWLQCRERFWEANGLDGSASTDLDIQTVLHSTVAQPGPRGILESFSAGARARSMAAREPDSRIDAAVAGLERVFPGALEFAEGGTSWAWSESPWARGAFSVFRPGQMDEFLPGLREPEGRVWFAGDALFGVPGYSHAAFASGKHVAKKIVEGA